MKLSIKVNEAGIIEDVRFKTFGCGSAIASSSYMTERVKGMTLEEAGKIKNTEIAQELSLPPVKVSHLAHEHVLCGQGMKMNLLTMFASLPIRATVAPLLDAGRGRHQGCYSRLRQQAKGNWQHEGWSHRCLSVRHYRSDYGHCPRRIWHCLKTGP
jgi:hypothetical protein